MKDKTLQNICWFVFVMAIIIIVTGLLSGCLDFSGYEECKNSYDNLKLEGGWRIIGHSSDFVSGAENRYFVTYTIECYANCTIRNEIKKVYGFVYDNENDELFYFPDSLTPDLPKEVISWS